MKTQKLLFCIFPKSVVYLRTKVYKIICLPNKKAKKARLIRNIVGLCSVDI